MEDLSFRTNRGVSCWSGWERRRGEDVLGIVGFLEFDEARGVGAVGVCYLLGMVGGEQIG
jgi:hypothetical protein